MSGDRQHILIVDDYGVLLATAREILELEGYTVLAASSAKEALESMEGTRPDLIVADIMMPVMDGYAFYEAVRSRRGWARIPFVFLTAKTAEEDFVRAKILGVDRYIIKPFRVVDLLGDIRALLARSGRLVERDGATEQVGTLRPTEADVDALLAYVEADTQQAPPAFASFWLCGRPTRWDLSRLRNDQLASLDTVARVAR